jgi:hypothetical protein
MDLQIIEKSEREWATFEGLICLHWEQELGSGSFFKYLYSPLLGPPISKEVGD